MQEKEVERGETEVGEGREEGRWSYGGLGGPVVYGQGGQRQQVRHRVIQEGALRLHLGVVVALVVAVVVVVVMIETMVAVRGKMEEVDRGNGGDHLFM